MDKVETLENLDKLELKTVLKGESLQKFIAIMKHYGLETYAEAIRICINDEFKLINLREKAFSKLSSILDEK